MKKVKYIVLVLIVLLVSGCGKKEEIQLSELSIQKNNMLNQVSNYTYKVTFDTKIDDHDFTIELDCKNNLDSKLGYCYTTNYYYGIEKYINYNNKVYYYRNVHPDSKTEWMTMNKYFNTNPNHFLNIVDSITDLRKEVTEEGIVYTGIIPSALKMAILLQEVDNRIDTGNINPDIKNMPIEVFINKNGFIEKITTCFDENEKVVITFMNYNETEKIEFPNDIK